LLEPPDDVRQISKRMSNVKTTKQDRDPARTDQHTRPHVSSGCNSIFLLFFALKWPCFGDQRTPYESSYPDAAGCIWRIANAHLNVARITGVCDIPWCPLGPAKTWLITLLLSETQRDTKIQYRNRYVVTQSTTSEHAISVLMSEMFHQFLVLRSMC
jgi:hypothetical protein